MRIHVFFSELVLFVEGFSDELVIKEAIKKIAPDLLYRISVIGCEGNSRFSLWTKFLNHFKNSHGQQIEWVVATDKDTLQSEVVEDFKKFNIANALDWDSLINFSKKNITIESSGLIKRNSTKLLSMKINRELNKVGIFLFEADIEYSLICEQSINNAHNTIRNFDLRGEATLKNFETIDKLATLIGSKGPNMNWSTSKDLRRKWKKPSLHKAIASALKDNEFSLELHRLVQFLRNRLENGRKN